MKKSVMANFSQIVSIPNVMSGAPCIQGTRIPVSTIVFLVRNENIEPTILVKDYFPQFCGNGSR